MARDHYAKMAVARDRAAHPLPLDERPRLADAGPLGLALPTDFGGGGDLAIQLHGGYGYSVNYEVEQLHRDAHGWAIAGGTPSMQRIRIASEYLGRRFDERR